MTNPGKTSRGAALILAALVGCARPERRAATDWAPPGSRGTTVGSDLLRAPSGTTIGPPSLGIDLIDHTDVSQPGAPSAVIRAGGPAPPAPTR